MLFCISHIIDLLSEGSYTLIISRQTITGVEKPLIRPVLVLDLWAWTYFVVLIFIHSDFLTVPPDFQYQNGKGIITNQSYVFKKFSIEGKSLFAEQFFFFIFCNENQEKQIKNHPVSFKKPTCVIISMVSVTQTSSHPLLQSFLPSQRRPSFNIIIKSLIGVK